VRQNLCGSQRLKLSLRATIKYFGCNFAMGGIPHEKVLRSMALFAKEVMPHFSASPLNT
jgi:hypothetical protein